MIHPSYARRLGVWGPAFCCFMVLLGCSGVIGGEEPLLGGEGLVDGPFVATVPEPHPGWVQSPSHCADGEATWFQCGMLDGTILSVCSSWPVSNRVGYIQVRTGVLESALVSVPVNRMPVVSTFEFEHSESLGAVGGLPNVVTRMTFLSDDPMFTLKHRIVPQQTAWVEEGEEGSPLRLECGQGIEGELQQLLFAIEGY
jgi:hypothetical protein